MRVRASSRHFSMIRSFHLADLFTIANGFCGLAAIAFAIGLNTGPDQIILIYFAICGLSRLARYNITADSLSTTTGKVEYFEGTPIPTSIVPLGLLLLLFHRGNLYPARLFGLDFHWPVGLFLISGCMMVSRTIRIPKP